MDKYDRQLRLWGPRGQRALVEARICLLTAGPTGSESLKNLVLPGCGHVTVVDGEVVTEADVGNNFFVDHASVGAARAEVVLRHLLELNPDVRGSAVVEDPVALIGRDPGYFRGFDLVIATQLPPRAARALAGVLWEGEVPLLLARTYGLQATLRLSVGEHVVLDSHPDSSVPDLRLAEAFPELAALAEGLDVDALDDAEHGHVPWPVLLLTALQRWRAATGAGADAVPRTGEERGALRAAVEALRRGEGEENVDEALEHVHLAWSVAGFATSADVQAVLGDEAATLDAVSALDARVRDAESTEDGRDGASLRRLCVRRDFWRLALALRLWVDEFGAQRHLPMLATLPDMTASTARYLALQAAYAAKAAQDEASFRACLARVSPHGVPPVADDVIATFLKNARHVRVLRPHALDAELRAADAVLRDADADVDADADAAAALPEAYVESVWELGEEQQAQAPALWHLALLAADDFFRHHERFPGSGPDETCDADAADLLPRIRKLFHAAGLDEVVAGAEDKYAAEITRYGACEPHAVAAVLGAVVAQEAVKVITHQFVPINNTFVFNGIASIMAHLRL